MIGALIFVLFFCLLCIFLLFDANKIWIIIAIVGVCVCLDIEEKKSLHRQEVIVWAVERPEYKSFKDAEAAYYKEIEAKKWEDEKRKVLEQQNTSQ